jgi:signal peptidase I
MKNPLVAPADNGLWHVVARSIQSITGPWTWENLVSWVKLVAIVLTVWWIGIQPFRIPSGSMEPTLHGDPGFFTGDRVFVNKWIYGPRIPFTNSRIFRLGEPRRWDVVVFRSVEPEEPRKILIKRVVGLPGERIHVYDGKIYVNGEPQELPENMPEVYYIGEMPPPEVKAAEIQATNPENFDTERLKWEERYRARYTLSSSRLQYGVREEDKYAVVPPDHYLMMGDNSANSQDGRYFGWVPHDNLLGRAFCVWWPIGNRKDLSGFTDTTVGLLLLFGIPGLLIGYEVCRAFFLLPWRLRGNALGKRAVKGERVFINRAKFGVRLPLLGIPVYPGRPPARGECVAFTVAVQAPGGASAPDLAFGVVAGTPGDTVSIEDGLVFVNGESTGRAAHRDGAPEEADSKERAKWLSKKKSTIPDEHYLVLADDGSAGPDSRMVGWVPKDSLVGTVSAVWWPPHRLRTVAKGEA